MPRVSVIIPVYNGEKYIGEALDSVFSQTSPDHEVIVVNDGSTDGTEQQLEKFTGRLRIIAQKNQGQSVSRQNGLRQSSGQFIAFLDADDIWLPRKLERQVEFATTHPEYGIVSTDAIFFDDSGTVLGSLKDKYMIQNGHVLEALLFDNWIPPSAALVRRECFEKVTTFDVPPPCYGEDWMMWMEIAAHYPVYFIDEVLVRRRLHTASVTSQGVDTQFPILLRNLQILEERIPQLRSRPSLVREAAYRVCLGRGVQDLRAIDLRPARHKLKRAIQCKPYAISAWGMLAATFVPAVLLRTLKKGMRWFRGLSDHI